MPLHFPNYRTVTDHLTRNGIAVLRYDDRGAGLSTGDYFSATGIDFAADASAAVDFLLSRDDINPEQVGVFGHSEGGGLAPMIAVDNPNVAFVIAMSGYAARGFDVLKVQTERILRAEAIPDDQVARRVELATNLYALALEDNEKATRDAAYDRDRSAIGKRIWAHNP